MSLEDFQEIKSLQNPKIKFTVKLRDRHTREKTDKTILEGYRELSRGSQFGLQITECFFCPSMFLGENEMSLIKCLQDKGTAIYKVPEHVLQKIAYRDRPEGLIAIALMGKHNLADLSTGSHALYLIAEAIEKPGNLGAMLRSADAVNVNGLVICDRCTDIYNPNVIRASTGALFTVPVAEASKIETYGWLKQNNIRIIASTPHAKTTYTDIDMTIGTALLVGTEQYGLTDFWLEKADSHVKIPMLGKIDSLNVATAATILLYEAARQRQWK